MSSIFQDTTFGNTLNWLSRAKLFPYREQKSDFVIPERYKKATATSQTTAGKLQLPSPAHQSHAWAPPASSASTRCPSPCLGADAESRHPSRADSDSTTLNNDNINDPQDATFHQDVEKATHLPKGQSAEKVQEQDPYLVDWYSEDDTDNPQNWSKAKKYTLLASVMLLTFAVYIGSAIYTPSVPGVMQAFGVSQTKALLGLSLYVLAYGIGPMLFSPLSEIPSIGRLNVYMVTLLIFVLLQIPTALAPNYEVLMAMRFFSGLVCSPALATGGATLADVFSPEVIPYVTALWSAGAVAGPTLGPVAGGYAAQEENWRWPLYMLLFLSLAALIVLFFFFAETSKATILLRRAQRLRKVTGNDHLRSQSEIDQSKMSGSQIVSTALLTPFRLLLEPIAFAIDLYVGLIYAVFYLWFESFPLVFGEIYGFGLGAQGLPFIGFIVALFPTLIVYFAYQRYKVIPDFKKTGTIIPESRLVVALVGAAIIPVALLLFGWLSRESLHWMGPVIAASLYLPGIFLVFQGAIVYLPMSYPNVAASVLAGNALVRGIVAAVFPLFGHALFVNLGIGPASSLLAGLSIVLIVPMWGLWKYGHRLRAHSKFASE